MVDNNQEQKLRDEILGDARLKAERLVARARNDAARIVEKAKSEASAKRKERLADAEKEMDVKCRSIAMGVETQLRRHFLNGREERLDAMLRRAVQEAASATGDEHVRSMSQLAGEAIGSMGGGDMLVYFPESDAGLVTVSWLESIASEVLGAGASYSFELHPSEDAPAGIRFVSADGRKEYDNTYESRLQKMKDGIRILLSGEA